MKAAQAGAAEREFLDRLRNPPPRIPVAEAREVPFAELTGLERSAFLCAFERAYADTVFGAAP